MTKAASLAKRSRKSGKVRPVVLRGTGVSPGIVIARALMFQHQEIPVIRIPLTKAEVKSECERMEAALRLSRRQLQEMKARTVDALGQEHAYIFDAQILMLEDPLLVERVFVDDSLAKSEC